MKRKSNISGVFSIKPLIFWQQCDGCEFEFRREYGWKVLAGPIVGGSYTIRYYCIDCCSTAEEARARADYVPPRPMPPSPPPLRIVKSM